MTRPVQLPHLILLFATLMAAPMGLSQTVEDPLGDVTGENAEFDFDETLVDPWIENETELPALPEPSQMWRIELDALAREFVLYVDRDGLIKDPRDRVVRVWLWLESNQGTSRGTFEGYRCETAEYKIYAYANPKSDRIVRDVKRPAWREIAKKGSAAYRSELMADFFCSIGTVNPTEQQIKTMLRQGPQRDRLFFND